ncbi:MAG: FAD synthase [Nitrososphaeraceae archaeon]|nr:FAD synthase [Nitrososphaeraceae archaeon]
MKSLDKIILGSLFISNLDKSLGFLDRLQERHQIDKKFFYPRILQLLEIGLIEKEKTNNNNYRLSILGREALKVVLVGGVFDILHPGHISTLKAAKSYGDLLIVVIATTSTAVKIKNNRRIYHSEELRKELVSALSFVDLALIGKEGTLFDTVEFVKPDIIALGYDQTHTEKYISENCKIRNIDTQVIRLNTPIPRSKSSEIKKELGEAVYDI